MLDQVIDHFGGRIRLAQTLGVLPAAVTNWKTRGVPLEQAVRIEILSNGAFTARQLCPKPYETENQNTP